MVISGKRKKKDVVIMKKVCIVLSLLIITLCGCGEGEVLPMPESSASAQEPHVVHISSTEAEEPEVTATPEPVSTVVDWEEVLALTAKYLPDMEALNNVLPDPVSVLDYNQGDLGFDGKEDIVIVYEYPETVGYRLSYRTIAIFTDEDGYKCTAFHETLILDSESGGTFGDPYQYTRIEDNGELHINFYGGSAWRWGYDLWFEQIDGELLMHRFVEEYSYSLTGDLVLLNHDFREQSTTCEAYWYTDEVNNDVNTGILYSYPWQVESVMPKFADIMDPMSVETPDIGVPLPIFDTFYGNDDNRSRFTDFLAEEVLDKVKEEYDSSMEKVMYDTKIFHLDEMSAFLGYEMPSYYYENADGVQLYYRTAEYDVENGWKHEIGVTGNGVYDTIFYSDVDYTSAEAQLRMLAGDESLEKMWQYSDENGGSYAVTDLDRNGRLEIIFSNNQGSGWYSYNNFFEVNEEYNSVAECTYYEYGHDSEADILWQDEVECYYDAEADIYYYIFSDTMRCGMYLYYENKNAIYIVDGDVKSLRLAFKESAWDEERGEWDVICTGMDGETIITEEDYDNVAARYFEGLTCEMIKIGWKEESSGKESTYAVLRESLAESSFAR